MADINVNIDLQSSLDRLSQAVQSVAHLTAFGISFVPSFLVIVLIITGRQLAQNPGTALVGLGTIWLGIVLVGVLDAWTLTKVLRR